MGIPGIFKELGVGERIALSKLAVEHLERTKRPLRIAIDAAIWQFQNQAGQGGKNPALRTFFYRLLKLLALPIQPVFVYDGKNKPLTKRNKSVRSYGTCLPNEMSKPLLQLFRFPHHTAPGEAEAECALLQKRGIVDAVMSQDADAIMFGSSMTLRNWTQESTTRGSQSATHVNVYRTSQIKEDANLDPDGMILVALLSGGDYDTNGVDGFGPGLACEIARAGFGAELLELIRDNDDDGLQEWRERLQYELESNESRWFKSKHLKVKIPRDFPDRTILQYYTNPAVSTDQDLTNLQSKWTELWGQELDIPALRKYVAETFDWVYKVGAKKLIRILTPALLAHRLIRGADDTRIDSSERIKGRRQDFLSDGMPEIRLEVIPADVVGLRLDAEEDKPVEDEVEDGEEPSNGADPIASTALQTTKRKTPPWDPSVAEKYWVPETLVQLGIPALFEEWQRRERDIRADPKEFALRKFSKSKVATKAKAIDKGMKTGSIESFFTTRPKSTSLDPGVVKSITQSPLQTCSTSNLTTIRKEPVTHAAPATLLNTKPDEVPKRKEAKPLSIKAAASLATQSFLSKSGNSNEAIRSNEIPHKSSSVTIPSRKHTRPASRQSLESHNATENLRIDGAQSQNLVILSQAARNVKNSASQPVLIGSSPPALREQEEISLHVDVTPDVPKSSPISCRSSQSGIPGPGIQARKRLQLTRPQLSSQSIRMGDAPTPIETFFKPSKSFTSSRMASKPAEAGLRLNHRQKNPVAAPRESVPRSPKTKMKVVSRDSIPGTWKEASVGHGVHDEEISTQSSSRSRISMIDMTID